MRPIEGILIGLGIGAGMWALIVGAAFLVTRAF